jgi:arabinogalactan oligomer/maltooligosaccharide transport system permease protein
MPIGQIEERTAQLRSGRPRRRRDPRVALALSVVPGMGQLYNGQWRKALFFLAATLVTLAPSLLLLMGGEKVGSALLRRHAFVAFLVVAFVSVLVFLGLFVLGLAFWASAAVDARRSAIELNEGRASDVRWWFLQL